MFLCYYRAMMFESRAGRAELEWCRRMPDFAFKMVQDAALGLGSPAFFIGASRPHCGLAGEPSCSSRFAWSDWQWVDGTSNTNLDCGSTGCGECH
jgi:hypothetical protein